MAYIDRKRPISPVNRNEKYLANKCRRPALPKKIVRRRNSLPAEDRPPARIEKRRSTTDAAVQTCSLQLKSTDTQTIVLTKEIAAQTENYCNSDEKLRDSNISSTSMVTICIYSFLRQLA